MTAIAPAWSPRSGATCPHGVHRTLTGGSGTRVGCDLGCLAGASRARSTSDRHPGSGGSRRVRGRLVGQHPARTVGFPMTRSPATQIETEAARFNVAVGKPPDDSADPLHRFAGWSLARRLTGIVCYQAGISKRSRWSGNTTHGEGVSRREVCPLLACWHFVGLQGGGN